MNDLTLSIWPLVLYFCATIILAALMIGISFFLGERHAERTTNLPYESGAISFGSARIRFSAKFYLVALFFVIFDLEAVFIFAWAVSIYDVGWTGYLEILVFITVLMAALAYLWRLGALDWASRRTEIGNHAR
ncbi:MAG: NADH-quinone oxidoreductase subunit A [Bdellovibrionia bacterium]